MVPQPSGVTNKPTKSWMNKPLMDVEEINNRQNGIELFLLKQFDPPRCKVQELLRRTVSVPQILFRLAKSSRKSSDFVHLRKTVSCMLAIHNILEKEILKLVYY